MPKSPSLHINSVFFLLGLSLLWLAAACAPAPTTQIRLAGNQAETRAVLELMLTSHQQWFSLVAAGEIMQPEASGETSVIEAASFRLGNPNQARVEIIDKEGVLARTWIANGVLIYDHDHRSLVTTQRSLPDISVSLMAIPAAVEALEGIRAHPMANLIPTELATFLFPAELAQQAGEYELAGEESIDERPTWQLDYANLLPGEDYRSARYWVDQQTGIVLLAQYFGPGGALVIEYGVHILELDGPIFEDYFRPWF